MANARVMGSELVEDFVNQYPRHTPSPCDFLQRHIVTNGVGREPPTGLVRMWFTRFSRFGISFSSPLVRRRVISRRNTPDFVQGSRNFTVLSAQIFAPPLLAAHASASVSSIRLANSGGVNTSSLERFAMHVNTSGLRLRKAKLAWWVIR